MPGSLRLSVEQHDFLLMTGLDALEIDLWDERSRAKIEPLQWHFGQHLLTLGLTVIIEWGTWGRSERDALRVRARGIEAAVELHYVTATVDVLFARVQSRRMENPRITREQIVQWMNGFQAPTPDETSKFDKFVMVEF